MKLKSSPYSGFYFVTGLLAGLVLLVTVKSAVAQVAPVEDIKKLRDLEEAIANSEQLLNKYPDNDFTPNLMFQLVELYVQRANYRFQRQMLVFEQEEKKAGQQHQLAAPKIDFSDALQLSKKLLAKYPDAPFQDKVLYRMGQCLLAEGRSEEAASYFERLSTQAKDRQLLEESFFRLGEFYFEKEDYQKAIDYYNRLLSSWDSPFFDMALYKLGWAYYNVDDYTQAIGTFIFLIEDINLLDEFGSEVMGKTKADLRKEAIEYIAICFAEYGGPPKAKEFLSEKKDKDYTEKILLHMEDIYRQRNFYEYAIESLNVLLDFYPNSAQAPQFQKQIVENYELAGEKQKADAVRARTIAKYGPGTSWLSQITEKKTRQAILDLVEEFLYTLGTEAQESAQAQQDTMKYELAIERYQSFLDKFPKSAKAHKIQFYLGECYYEIGQFEKAATTYYELTLKYPDSEFYETAAYNRILAYNRLLEESSGEEWNDFFLFNFLGKDRTKVEVVKVKNSRQAQLLQAMNDFAVFLPDSPKLPEVLMNLGQILYDIEQYVLAKEIFEKVVTISASGQYLPQAYTMIAQCQFQKHNYLAAEESFRRVKSFFPDSSKFVTLANRMISSARFKLAEHYLEIGDSTRAATEFEHLADTAPDSSIGERALFEAAKQYENLGDEKKAIAVYESMLSKFPHSDLVAESLLKAGVLSEEQRDWQRAATNYLNLYETNKTSPYAARSVFAAAKCYENLLNFEQARKYYGEYIDHFNADANQFLEAAFKKAQIDYTLNQPNAAEELQFVTTAYEKFSEKNTLVENYFPANAQFLLGEIKFAAFEKMKLTNPLQKSLKRKRAEFEKVIKTYTEAAKYKVAEWTTAASHKIGLTFEHFANVLLESPRPKNLTPEQLHEYNEKLWQNVLPLKQKALQTFEANVKQAEEHNIENVWVEESRKKLQELKLELGLRPGVDGSERGS